MKTLALFLTLFISTIAFSAENQCVNTQMGVDLEMLFAQEMLLNSPYCLWAIKKLKAQPIKNQTTFNQLVENEIVEIEKYFDQRSDKSYGVISSFMKSVRSKKAPQKDLTSLNARKKSFDGLTSDCDKLKHCAVSCKLAYSCGFYGSRAIGRFKEIFHDLILGKGSADFDDIIANEVGLSLSDTVITDDATTEDVYTACEKSCASNILRLHTVYYDYRGEKFCK